MRQQIQQGAVFDFLTKQELQEEMGHRFDALIRDMARGVKLIRFRQPATTDAIGNFTTLIPGPESGYIWDIKRVTVAGSAYFPSNNSASASGAVTAPGAGATIAQVPLGIGTYRVDWIVGLGGTVTAADRDNFQLFQSGTGSNFAIENSINRGTNGDYPQNSVTITSTNTNNFIKILTIAAGSAAAIYTGQLAVTQIGTDATNTALYRGGSTADADANHFMSYVESASGNSADFGGVAATFPKLSVTYMGGENLIVVGSALVPNASAFVNGQALEVPAEMIAKLL